MNYFDIWLEKLPGTARKQHRDRHFKSTSFVRQVLGLGIFLVFPRFLLSSLFQDFFKKAPNEIVLNTGNSCMKRTLCAFIPLRSSSIFFPSEKFHNRSTVHIFWNRHTGNVQKCWCYVDIQHHLFHPSRKIYCLIKEPPCLSNVSTYRWLSKNPNIRTCIFLS